MPRRRPPPCRQAGAANRKRGPQGRLNLIDAAEAAGLRHFVLVSFPPVNVDFPQIVLRGMRSKTGCANSRMAPPRFSGDVLHRGLAEPRAGLSIPPARPDLAAASTGAGSHSPGRPLDSRWRLAHGRGARTPPSKRGPGRIESARGSRVGRTNRRQINRCPDVPVDALRERHAAAPISCSSRSPG